MRKITLVHALASALASAIALAAAPALAGTAHHVGNGAGWGNSQFNASYDLWMGLNTKQDLVNAAPPALIPLLEQTLPADTAVIGGCADAFVTAFGDEKYVAHVEGYATRSNGTLSSDYELQVLGTTLLSGSFAGNISKTWSTEFFSAEDTILVADVIPVVVTASVTGELGVSGTVGLHSEDITINATPYAKAYVTGSIGIGADCVSAGIQGQLTALEVTLPVTVKASFPPSNPNAIDFSVNCNLTLSSLDGSMGFYADACAVSTEYNIFSWPGYTFVNQSLLSANGTLAI
jgi:hypothetical protein